LLEEITKVQERSFKELELPDPEKTRLQITPKGRKPVSREKDTTPRQKRYK
jgi:hypothetical protein